MEKTNATKGNSLDKQYQELLKTILEHGVEKKDRTGTGTKSIFGYTIRHNMSEGFPILTSKKVAFKTMATELLWFLRGDNTSIRYLLKNNCNIWTGDCYQAYLRECERYKKNNIEYMNEDGTPFSKEQFIEKIKTDKEFSDRFGNLGPIYGKQWRSWDSYTVKPGLVCRPDGSYNENYWDYDKSIDQIQNLINDLKTNPDSRRLMVSAWNPVDLPVTDYRTDDELYRDYLKDFEK